MGIGDSLAGLRAGGARVRAPTLITGNIGTSLTAGCRGRQA